MKNFAETTALILANIFAWTVNNLNEIEMVLKLVLLVISIMIGARKLLSKKEK